MIARDLDFDADYRCVYLGPCRIVGVPREWQPAFHYKRGRLVADEMHGEWVENDASDIVIVSPLGSEQQFYVKVADLLPIDTPSVNL